MKAVVIPRFGGPDVLEMQDIPKPEAEDHHLLVRIQAAGINPVDSKIRSGKISPESDLPIVAGADAAGVIEAAGPMADERFRPGVAVFGCLGLGKTGGACAEYGLLDDRVAAVKPDELSFADAASLPIVAITAWESLYDRADIQEGQIVVIHAGAGGVGSLGIQLAALREAIVVTTASRPEHIEFCKRLGADHVINYKETDFVEAVLDLTGGRGAPVIVDNVGGDTFRRSMDALAPGGQLVTIVERGEVDAMPLFGLSATLHFEFMGAPAMRGHFPERQGRILERVGQMVAAGKLRATVSKTLPFDAFREAHEQIDSGHTMGKIVLEINRSES